MFYKSYNITEQKIAEDALDFERRQLLSIFDSIDEAVYISDPKTYEVLYANQVSKKVFGDSTGQKCYFVFQELDVPCPFCTNEHIFGENLGKTYIWEHQNKISKRWYRCIDKAIYWLDGRLVRYEMAIDINDRKLAEKALRDSEEMYRTIFETTGTATVILEEDMTISLANTEFEKLSGFSKGELKGVKWLDFICKEEHSRIKEYHYKRRADHDGAPRSYEFRFVDIYGNVSDILSTVSVIPGTKKSVVSLLDITVRKQAEEAIRESEEKFRKLFNNAKDAIFLLSIDSVPNRFIEVNDIACKRLGYSREEFLKLTTADITDEQYMDCLPKILMECKEKGHFTFELNHVSKDKQKIPVEINSHLFTLNKKQVVLSVARDITDRKQAEERLHREAAEKARLLAEAERRLKQLQALRSIDLAITGNLDLSAVLNTVLDQVTARLGVHAADILLLNPNTKTLEYSVGRGFRSRGAERSRRRLVEYNAAWATSQCRHVFIPDLTAAENSFAHTTMPAEEGFVTCYAVPLAVKGQVKGVLEIFHRDFLELDKELLGFFEAMAGQAAIAIDNAELFSELQRSNIELTLAYDTTIEGWSYALDLRDRETEGHSRRVTEMTIRLARAIGMSEAELVHVRRGALLHDIGKLGVPDHILLKPGALTEEEWAIMRRHPVLAYEMLSPIAYLRPALDIPYCHHEKWDGTGYPRGLKGEQIPLAARVFAVVDVFDALRSVRPYRPALPEKEVLMYIHSQAGKLFDPIILKAFLETEVQQSCKQMKSGFMRI